MTLEDLQGQGVLLPEEEWGEYELTSTVPRPILVVLFAIATLSIAVSLIADGGVLTFVAIGVFILDLFGLTLVLDRSVVRLRARVRTRRREIGGKAPVEGGEGSGAESKGDGEPKAD